MALGIYKQGQGYWIRVMSAVMIGALILAGAGWAFNQGKTISIPARSWTLSLIDTEGDETIAGGETVALLGYVGASNELTEIGRAQVETFAKDRGSSSTLVISGFDSEETRDRAGAAEAVVIESGGLPIVTAEVRGTSSTPVFEVLYLQTGLAALVMVLGAIGLYIYVGTSKKSVEFLIATDGEMKKVNWTTYREVKGSTIVVIVATFLIAGFLFAVDTVFASFFELVGVLEGR